jgi:hypothetical protein
MAKNVPRPTNSLCKMGSETNGFKRHKENLKERFCLQRLKPSMFGITKFVNVTNYDRWVMSRQSRGQVITNDLFAKKYEQNSS